MTEADERIRELESRVAELEAKIETALNRAAMVIAKLKTHPLFGQVAKMMEL